VRAAFLDASVIPTGAGVHVFAVAGENSWSCSRRRRLNAAN